MVSGKEGILLCLQLKNYVKSLAVRLMISLNSFLKKRNRASIAFKEALIIYNVLLIYSFSKLINFNQFIFSCAKTEFSCSFDCMNTM